MGNGEWGMGNGEWGMGNGEWGMGNGEWGMPRAAFSTLISKFLAIRTDLEPFLSALNWLTSGFVYATLSFNQLMHCLQNYFDLLYVSCI